MNTTRRQLQHRWRCLLCIAFGYEATEQAAINGFEQHYVTKHMGRTVTRGATA